MAPLQLPKPKLEELHMNIVNKLVGNGFRWICKSHDNTASATCSDDQQANGTNFLNQYEWRKLPFASSYKKRHITTWLEFFNDNSANSWCSLPLKSTMRASVQLAERMLLAAHQLCPADPATCHELGVLNYRNGQYAVATSWLHTALGLVPSEHGRPKQQLESSCIRDLKLSSTWEPTVFALGHCLRKQRRWAEALQVQRGVEEGVPSRHCIG
jgi:hypothetical protein